MHNVGPRCVKSATSTSAAEQVTSTRRESILSLEETVHLRTRHCDHEQHEPSVGQGVNQTRGGPNTTVKSCGLSQRPQQVAHLLQALRERLCNLRVRRPLATVQKHLEFSRQKVRILPTPDRGNKLDDHFFRLKRLTGEPMTEWSIRSDQVYRRLLSALERANGKKTHFHISDRVRRHATQHFPISDRHQPSPRPPPL